jgi:hypothetical protein
LRPTFSVWLHDIVASQIKDVLATADDLTEKQVITALQELKDALGSSNPTFHENNDPGFVGKIHKIYVGGKNRYRLLNICLADQKIVIPFYLSEVPRRSLDYKKINWQEPALEIHNDFVKGRKEKFRKI